MANDGAKYLKALYEQLEMPLKVYNKTIEESINKTQKLNEFIDRGKKDPYRNVSSSLAELRKKVEQYKDKAENSFNTDDIRKYKEEISKTESQIKKLERGTLSWNEKTKGAFEEFQNFSSSSGFNLVKNASKAIYDFGKQSVEAASQVEQYGTSVRYAMGSKSGANIRMNEYRQFARKTPFDLGEVVAGGNQLQTFGRYSKENFNMLGDLATATGKPLEQAISAFGALANGQKNEAIGLFQGLNVGINDWIRATGKGVKKNGELKASTEDMVAALPKILLSKGYFGAMAEQAETTKSKMQNLNESVFSLKSALGEHLSPAVNSFSDYTSKAIDKITSWVEIPLEKKIAQERFELNNLVDSLITNLDKEEQRKTIIDELNRKFPEFLKNLNTEKMTAEQLQGELVKVNKEYGKKMRNATYARKLSEVEKEMGNEKTLIDKYEASIDAKIKLEKIQTDFKIFTAKNYRELGIPLKMIEDNAVRAKLTSNTAVIKYGYGATMTTVSIPEKFADEILNLKMDYAVADEVARFFDNDKELLSKAEQAYKKLQYKKNSILKSLDENTITDPFPSDNASYNEDGGINGSINPVVITPATNNRNKITEIERVADSISSGGRPVKNFNITINDGLVKEVHNNFASSSDNPETASDFMWRLSSALQMILNDVNYAAS